MQCHAGHRLGVALINYLLTYSVSYCVVYVCKDCFCNVYNLFSAYYIIVVRVSSRNGTVVRRIGLCVHYDGYDDIVSPIWRKTHLPHSKNCVPHISVATNTSDNTDDGDRDARIIQGCRGNYQKYLFLISFWSISFYPSPMVHLSNSYPIRWTYYSPILGAISWTSCLLDTRLRQYHGYVGVIAAWGTLS